MGLTPAVNSFPVAFTYPGAMTTGSATERPSRAGRLVVVRHGQTRWSQSGQHTGHTDIRLTPEGEHRAREAAYRLAEFDIVAAYSSPLLRARRTAELLGLRDAEFLPELMEWDYGGYEGMTTDAISARVGRPWSLWDDGVVPGPTPGESIEQVAARARTVLGIVAPQLTSGDVVVVAHGHLLRVLAGVFIGQDPRFGAHLGLDPASISVLGTDHDLRAILRWNEIR